MCKKIVLACGIALYALLPAHLYGQSTLQMNGQSHQVGSMIRTQLEKELAARGLSWGAPVFLRIFKDEGELEVWIERDCAYKLFRRFSICALSGRLGPKLRQGDQQGPEGFYSVRIGQLNPHSKYHLSFDIGYPNAFDRAHGRTGGDIMVHGDCVSIGCFAMTDPGIDVIYILVEAALLSGQREVPVHIFPFHLTEDSLQRYRSSRWYDFWSSLQTGYAYFGYKQYPPEVGVEDGNYIFRIPACDE